MNKTAQRWRITLAHLISLELALAVGALVITLSLCLAQAPRLIGKSRAVGLFYASHPSALAMIEEHAMTGELPSQTEPLLGLRPAEAQQGFSSNLIWLCGDRLPPPGWVASPPTSASAPLFSVCRESRSPS